MARYEYQTSPVQAIQQKQAIPMGKDLVATFDAANYPGYKLYRVSISGPQVPKGSYCRIYRDVIAATSLLTTVDRTDANNWNPPTPQDLWPGSQLIVVWENAAALGTAYATMNVGVAD